MSAEPILRAKELLSQSRFDECLGMLQRLPAELQHAPTILELRFTCLVELRALNMALAVAEELFTVCPESPWPYSYKSSALAVLGRVEEGYSVALDGYRRFPECFILSEALVWFSGHLRNATAATRHVKHAVRIADGCQIGSLLNCTLLKIQDDAIRQDLIALIQQWQAVRRQLAPWN